MQRRRQQEKRKKERKKDNPLVLSSLVLNPLENDKAMTELYTTVKQGPHAYYPVEPRRFKVIFAIAWMGAACMTQWLSTAPGSDTLCVYFGLTSSIIFQLFANGAFYIGSVFGVALALGCVSAGHGIRRLTIMGSSLVWFGTLLRLMSFNQGTAGFVMLVLGNTTSGFASALMIVMCTHVPLVWFGMSEQTTATGLTVGGAGIGAVVGYILGAVMITDSSNVGMWVGLNVIIFGLAAIGWLLVFVLVDDKPVYYPSLAASKSDIHHLTWQTFKEDVVRHTHTYFWIMVVQLTLGVGVYFTLQTTLQTIMNDQGYSRYEQNAAGISFQIVGLVGTIGFSVLVDKFHLLHVGSIVAWVLSFVMFGLLGMRVVTTWLGSDIIVLYVLSSLSGLVFSSVPPLALQLACNTVFPFPPGLVSVCLFLLAQIGTLGVLGSTQSVNSQTAWIIMLSLLGVAMLLSISNYWAPLRQDLVNGREIEPVTALVPSHRKSSRRKSEWV